MVEVVYHANFLKSAALLPSPQRKKLSALIERLKNNPYDSLLHTKRLSTPLIGFLSFRITRDWRVLFCFIDEKTTQLVRVAHRNDIYR